MELDYRTHKTRSIYKCVNALKGTHKKEERFLKNHNVSLITTNEKLANKWRKYFEKAV